MNLHIRSLQCSLEQRFFNTFRAMKPFEDLRKPTDFFSQKNDVNAQNKIERYRIYIYIYIYICICVCVCVRACVLQSVLLTVIRKEIDYV